MTLLTSNAWQLMTDFTTFHFQQNRVQLAFDSNSGHRIPCYDWKSFLLAQFKTILSITNYHHFKHSSSKPGVVELNGFVQSSTEEVNILKTDVSIDLQEMPKVIPPPGIPPERQKYLYKQIRIFCEPEYADITCPQLKLKSETDQLAVSVEESNCRPTKCARLCSHYRHPGHTKTVCGKIMCPEFLS